jgi:adenylate cyclase
MSELVAKGENPNDGWRRTVPSQPVTLGRDGTKSNWAADWDNEISRQHASLTWHGGKLLVRRLPAGRNPIFFKGEPLDEFAMAPGETFAIGRTVFCLEEGTSDPPTPYTELTCSREDLRNVPYLDAAQRIEVLSDLPGVIRFSPSEEELAARVVEVLLGGIPRAEWAAVVRLSSEADNAQVQVHFAKSRDHRLQNVRPSSRLTYRAINHLRERFLHIWHPGALTPFTVDARFNWALCVPLSDEPSPGWGVYVAGSIDLSAFAGGDAALTNLLKPDLKFAELTAEIFGALRQVLDLQRHQTLLRRFLTRPVLAALAETTNLDKVLQPRETEVTVLFCDLRGSCRAAEKGQADLQRLWNRVSTALNIMAGCIVDEDGVIGDFQGDAAMGFWGWPLPCEDRVERAARVALRIRRQFAHAAQQPEHPLADFTCGIGIATGPAIAGKLGTVDQFKVDVFGPTVNLASRLESMTKLWRVPILLDENSANRLRTAKWARCRPLARVQPYGMEATVLTLSELLPPAVEHDVLPEHSRKDYEAALGAFLNGRWDDAARLLNRLPGDGPAEFLKSFMDAHHQTPPAGWSENNHIPIDTK